MSVLMLLGLSAIHVGSWLVLEVVQVSWRLLDAQDVNGTGVARSNEHSGGESKELSSELHDVDW